VGKGDIAKAEEVLTYRSFIAWRLVKRKKKERKGKAKGTDRSLHSYQLYNKKDNADCYLEISGMLLDSLK
jgi:hypothetical protein